VVSRALKEASALLPEVQLTGLGKVLEQWLGFKKVAEERIALLTGDHSYQVEHQCHNPKVCVLQVILLYIDVHMHHPYSAGNQKPPSDVQVVS
jgi:hypothetical protein